VHPGPGYWVIHRALLRERGVALPGPPPATLIDPVTPAALGEAVTDVLHAWWAPMLTDPGRLHSWGYRCHAVLTMCRMLYTREHGTIVSKAVAADWAQANLPARFTPPIARARAWSAAASPDVDETRALVRYTLERRGG